MVAADRGRANENSAVQIRNERLRVRWQAATASACNVCNRSKSGTGYRANASGKIPQQRRSWPVPIDHWLCTPASGYSVWRSSCLPVWPLLAARTALRSHPIPWRGLTTAKPDWNDASQVIPLNYQQAQGKRVFYQYCVWCHADSTPAGPSNRSNLNPNPPLANDGATLNALSDDFMRNVITMGGAAAGKSASMPPWGKTLSQDDIEAVIAFYRAIAQPPYQAPARPGPKYSVR